jgi:chromate transporter
VPDIASPAAPPVSFREALRFWTKLGFINFGGPSGQIALMHEELVERKRWIGEGRFLHALAFCMLLPGPEAQQLAIYVGWLLHKVRGGIVAGVLFVVPSFFLMMLLSWAYAAHGTVSWVAGVFSGLSAAVLGMVLAALLRIGSRALTNGFAVAISLASFVAIFVLGVPFPLVVIGAGTLGYTAARLRPGLVAVPAELGSDAGVAIDDATFDAPHTRPSTRRAIRVVVVGVAVWWIPLLGVVAWRGAGDVLSTEALFFSTAAVVTFGGAYAVLAYVNQASVYRFGWLSPSDVVAGLGLAESTPGPLIMVAEFVGFLAAYRLHGDLRPLTAGIIGASITVWSTFAPCFLWVFLAAPYVERVRANRRLGSALGAITGAIVGVIASLALTFGVNVLFHRVVLHRPFLVPISIPAADTLNVFALVVAVSAFVAIRRFRWNPALVALACGAAGFLRSVAR